MDGRGTPEGISEHHVKLCMPLVDCEALVRRADLH